MRDVAYDRNWKTLKKATIYGQLGYILDNLSNYRQAISSYKNALEIMHRLVSRNPEALASTI